MERLSLQNAQAAYQQWSVPAPNDREIRTRYIRPVREGAFPTMLMFHDLGRGIRGWYHMTRFAALGYVVVALESQTSVADWRHDRAALSLGDRYLDTLTLVHATIDLSSTDPARLMTWDEGSDDGLAIVAASLVSDVIRCAALSPLPGDLGVMCGGVAGTDRVVLDGLDPASFAALLTCPLLLGVGLLDRMASPECQYAIFDQAWGPKTYLVYSKYEHERVNFFENELPRFFHI